MTLVFFTYKLAIVNCLNSNWNLLKQFVSMRSEVVATHNFEHMKWNTYSNVSTNVVQALRVSPSFRLKWFRVQDSTTSSSNSSDFWSPRKYTVKQWNQTDKLHPKFSKRQKSKLWTINLSCTYITSVLINHNPVNKNSYLNINKGFSSLNNRLPLSRN